jgi:predicted 3-demethylubiquinone-9 3-methyltransferase (glyoxalase superfamily)
MNMQKITPFLWFDQQAEDAVRLYVSIFPDSEIRTITRYGDAGPGPKGSVMTIGFKLAGMEFAALNGGPTYKFTEAISFVIHCDSQQEVDHYWNKLVDGGQPIQCGWLKDRFGLAWQIVPRRFFELIKDPDPQKVQRVMRAMFGMVKFDIAGLEKAYRGDS